MIFLQRSASIPPRADRSKFGGHPPHEIGVAFSMLVSVLYGLPYLVLPVDAGNGDALRRHVERLGEHVSVAPRDVCPSSSKNDPKSGGERALIILQQICRDSCSAESKPNFANKYKY